MIVSPTALGPAFRPPWWLRNGHTNTVYSFLRPRRVHLPVAHSDWLPVAEGVDLLLRSHWQAHAAPALLLVHGLEGSSEAGYMLTTAERALARGMHVIRMNVRGCGEAETRCAGLYNSGMSGDVARALAWVVSRPLVNEVALAGFSMGGNLVLKYAGECGAEAPAALRAVVAVSPCLDLDACATALHRKANYLYERRFLVNLKKRLLRHAARFPGRYPVERLEGLTSVRDFDDAFTGPFTGYRDAADYYEHASAARVVAAIHVPTLVLQAEDDPFIVITPATRALLAANPACQFVPVAHGGHCGFINSRWPQARPAFAGGSAPYNEPPARLPSLRSAPPRPRKDRPSGPSGQSFSPATEWDLVGTPFLGFDLAPVESTRPSRREGVYWAENRVVDFCAARCLEPVNNASIVRQ